jgi:hypothetical protein
MLGTNGVSKIEPPLVIPPNKITQHKTEFVVPEDFIEEIPKNNTLFAALFQAYNTKEKNIKPEYVLLYRKEISESLDKVNPYSLEGKNIFESAGNGFLEKISVDIDHAKAWIMSENELTPEYISWIPDVIGSNINVNNVEYKTTFPSSNTIILDYEPTIKIYTLKV